MKKVLVIIILCLTFLISYLLQSNFFNWFTIAGIKPNIFIILVLCIGLFAGKSTGSILGMIFGMLIDIFIGKKPEMSAILLGIVGFAGGYFDKNFSKDSKITIMLMCLGATVFYEIVNYFILVTIYQMEIEILALTKIVAIEESWLKPNSSFKYSSLSVDGLEEITSQMLLKLSSSGNGTGGKRRYSFPFSRL